MTTAETEPRPAPRGGVPRPEKVAVVEEVRERLSSSSAALLTEYRGMKVGELAQLRRNLRAVGGDYKVYKNTLVRFAVRELGHEHLEELLVGPTAIAFVDGDAAAVAKALRDFARGNPNLTVKGGLLGEKALTADEARALAELPSREVLLARLAGGIAAPLQQLAGLFQALPRNLAYGLKALIDQGGAPGAPADAAPAAAPEEAPQTEAGGDEAPTVDEGSAPPADAAPAAAPEEAPQTETGGDEAPTVDEGSAPPADAAPAEAASEEAPQTETGSDEASTGDEGSGAFADAAAVAAPEEPVTDPAEGIDPEAPTQTEAAPAAEAPDETPEEA